MLKMQVSYAIGFYICCVNEWYANVGVALFFSQDKLFSNLFSKTKGFALLNSFHKTPVFQNSFPKQKGFAPLETL
jgi:hypothetical protein